MNVELVELGDKAVDARHGLWAYVKYLTYVVWQRAEGMS
jgi:hypothetical protein